MTDLTDFQRMVHDPLRRHAEQLRRENRRLRRALEWYAERRNYLPPAGSNPAYDVRAGWRATQDAFDDEGPGARAREALKEGAPS